MNKISYVMASIFLTVCLCISGGCSDTGARETIKFILPDWKELSTTSLSATNPLSAEITASGPDFPELTVWFIEVEGTEISEQFYTRKNSLEFTLPKNQSFCITATPVTEFGEGTVTEFFYPAGTIYPYFMDSNNSRMELTWQQGFSATLMKRIFRSKISTGVTDAHIKEFLKSFNWYKLQNTINTKTEESLAEETATFYNPWLVDSESLLNDLCCGTFSAAYLNMKTVYSISLETMGLEDCSSVLVPYVPENFYLEENKKITCKKNEILTAVCNQKYAAQITAASAKKVSVVFSYLPILYSNL